MLPFYNDWDRSFTEMRRQMTQLLDDFDSDWPSPSFALPRGLDTDKVKAEFSNGVLWLHLPKSPAIKPRQIQVRAG